MRPGFQKKVGGPAVCVCALSPTRSDRSLSRPSFSAVLRLDPHGAHRETCNENHSCARATAYETPPRRRIRQHTRGRRRSSPGSPAHHDEHSLLLLADGLLELLEVGISEDGPEDIALHADEVDGDEVRVLDAPESSARARQMPAPDPSAGGQCASGRRVAHLKIRVSESEQNSALVTGTSKPQSPVLESACSLKD